MSATDQLRAALPAMAGQLAAEIAGVGYDDVTAYQDEPRAPVATGAAGMAYALLHLADARADDDARAAATSLARAAAADQATDAYAPDQPGIAFGRAGVAWIACRACDGVDDALVPQLAEAPAECDLFRGLAGHLVAATDLAQRGHERYGVIADALASMLLDRARPGDGGALRWPGAAAGGIAHGLAGICYALIGWEIARDRSPGDWVEPTLGALATAPLAPPTPELEGSLCNGAAGIALLYARAHEWLGAGWLADVALGAGRDLLATPPRGGTDLCCGAAGEAYALMALAHIDDRGPWMDRAAERAIVALSEPMPSLGVLKGTAAQLCLALDVLDASPHVPLLRP